MAKTSWDLALIRGLKDNKFTGKLTIRYQDGEAVGHELSGGLRRSRLVRLSKGEKKALQSATAQSA